MARIPMVRAQLRHGGGGDLQFTPQAVTIGPYHHLVGVAGSPAFPWTEDHKKQAVHAIETQLEYAGRDLEGLERVVATQEPRVRECYTHPLHPEMFDSGLSHEQLQQHITETTRDNTLVRDILYLLENQIPLFLLDRMYEYITGRRSGGQADAPPSAVDCIAGHVQNILQKQLYISNKKRPSPAMSTCSDLLHLVYYYIRQRRPQKLPPATEPERSLTGRWRRAADYSCHADVRFCRRVFTPGDDWTILDISYDGGTLYMPLLRVGGSTLTMLRNLMALEEQLPERPVTAYCYLLSQLACTAEDVALLQDACVLGHFLGSDDQAARSFADLCNGVALDIDNLDRNYLKPIWHQLDRRCRTSVHGFKGVFREQYGSSVFNAMVFCVAFIHFVCQVIQVVYAVLAYHRPPN